MLLNYPDLAKLMFEELRNSCYRLHDDSVQISKAKQLAAKVYRSVIKQQNPNVSSDTFKSQWVSFTELPVPGRKTKVFRVYGIGHGHLLGHVKWWNEKYAYGFAPAAECFFDTNGLSDIHEFISLLMSEREAEKVQQLKNAAQ